MPKGVYDRAPRPAIIPIGPSIAYLPLSDGGFALVDREDAALADVHKWSPRWDHNGECSCAQANIRTGNGWKSVTLHTFILGRADGLQIDHIIPGNGLDCRRANLRRATRSQQQRNKRTPRNNRLGLKGVTTYKRPGRNVRYRARIWVDGKSKLIGSSFKSPQEAFAAREAATRKYHGEFGRSA